MRNQEVRYRTNSLNNNKNDGYHFPVKVVQMGPMEGRKGDRYKRMDLRRVIKDLRYVVKGFTILALGNWGDGNEG